jgi:hypothetical protein
VHLALAIARTVEAIQKNPLRFPVVGKNLRRSWVRRSPYGIFFEVADHWIAVIACFHG